ncbi:MinD/ParA family ATP-binding protein [Corynebacterium mayonis]|uniref:MinD/ParA family ATP-binding protein n=1 Tax=Corynebacterium mayonis TaxID=3062461 RepID=UPI003140A05A
MLYTLSFGLIDLGDSEKELRREAMLERIRTPLKGDYRIAVMSLKGGVGKTTTTVVLGGVLAEARGDRVVAIDANPDLGTLAQRVAAPGSATIRDLLAAEDTSSYSQVKSYTTQAKSRLEVVGSERDPAVSEEFSESDYREAISILRRHYSVILTDCGTGLMHSAMGGVLDLADTLVLVTSAALDGAQSAAATLDWLNLHGYEQLAANSVVVVSSPPQQRSAIDLERLVGHFRARTRAVHVIPFDAHLAEGGSVDLDLLARSTREAYDQLAATIAHDFSKVDR